MSRPRREDDEELDRNAEFEDDLTPEEEADLEEELRAGERRYFNVSRSLSASLIFVLPLLGIYELGVLLLRFDVNAAAVLAKTPISWLRRHPIEILGVSPTLVLNGVIIAAVLLAVWRLGRIGALRARTFFGMFVESAAYALVLGPVALFPLTGTLEFGGFAPRFDNFFVSLVASSGAGFYEELLFRFILLGAIFFLAKKVANMKSVTAGALGLVLSGAVFSAAHFFSPGESAALGIFIYRLAAGMVLGLIFLMRGFGIAVWTHALYDIYVMCFAAT